MIYKAGEEVPAEWFSRLENMVSIKFGVDCEVSIIDGKRIVQPVTNGTVIHFQGNGESTVIEAAIPLLVMDRPNQQLGAGR